MGIGNMLNVYVSRVGNAVEIRVASVPPIAKVSKLTKIVNVTAQRVKYLDVPPYYRYYSEYIPKKLVLKQVFFMGGRVIGYAKAATFERQFKLKIPKDKMIRLGTEQGKVVTSKAWRKINLW